MKKDLKTLLIDDIRTLEMNEPDVIARNYDSARMLLHEFDWKRIYIDHDLGEEDVTKTGYKLISDALEIGVLKHTKSIIIVSSNPVGVDNIRRALLKHGWKPSISGITFTKE